MYLKIIFFFITFNFLFAEKEKDDFQMHDNYKRIISIIVEENLKIFF